MRVKSAYILFLVAATLPVLEVYASEITMQATKTSLASADEEFQVNLSLTVNNADNKTYYLRGVFEQTGSENYCGYTWNGRNWFSGPYSSNDGWKSFLPVTVISSTWSGELKARINTSDSGCRVSGNYFFKIQRFTESGSASFDTQNELNLSIIIPTVTPTPEPTVKPTHTPSSTQTPYPNPTSTPKSYPSQVNPSSTIYLINTKPYSSLLSKQAEADPNTASSSPTSVLGIQSEETSQPGPVTDESKPSYKPLIISFSLIGLGLASLSAGMLMKNRQKTYDENHA